MRACRVRDTFLRAIRGASAGKNNLSVLQAAVETALLFKHPRSHFLSAQKAPTGPDVLVVHFVGALCNTKKRRARLQVRPCSSAPQSPKTEAFIKVNFAICSPATTKYESESESGEYIPEVAHSIHLIVRKRNISAKMSVFKRE